MNASKSGQGRGRSTDAPRLARLASKILMPVLFASLAACEAGSGEGLDVSGRPLSEGGDLPLAATLESIQVNVFDAYCTLCHAGAAAPLGLRLDTANSYTNLVGVSSRQDGSLLRVDPGNPDASYLVRKLEGTAATGARMPLGGPPVPDTTIAFVRQWITDGAPPAASSQGSALAVLSVAFAPGNARSALPAEIVVGFNGDIDASTVNGMTFVLEHAGADGMFGGGDDVIVAPASIARAAANPRVAVLGLAGIDAPEGAYRLTVRGSGASVLLSVDGRPLDGDFSGGLPSGDASDGGDFVLEFAVGADE